MVGVGAVGPDDLAHVPGGEGVAHARRIPERGRHLRRAEAYVASLLLAAGVPRRAVVAGKLRPARTQRAARLSMIVLVSGSDGVRTEVARVRISALIIYALDA